MNYILIAEDDPLYGKLLRHHLLDLGVHILHVSNGAEALSCIRENPPQLLLLDMIMPVMTGFEVLEVLRQSEKRPRKIIVLTNLEQDEDIQTMYTLGADIHIGKSSSTLPEIILKISDQLRQD